MFDIEIDILRIMHGSIFY